ncbi:MAG: hypothetical protein BWY79_01263 [Actinobacteria bacterium ADurb.Bin444]|nr:MAG: hypothetical protein BWY79_01263 [Actinobacteria bacterium ADurb.Bin444]
MVRLDRVTYRVALAITPGQVGANDRVGPLHLVIHGFAQIVKQPGAFCQFGVGSQLVGHHARQVADFQGMGQDILAVACPVAQTAQDLDQFRSKAVDIGVERGLFTRLLDLLLHLFFGLAVHLLDLGRMDTTVGDELGEGQPGDLTPHGVKTRKHHRLRGVIDDEIDAGQVFERANVTTLTADDAPLHIVRRQSHHRHGSVGHVRSRGALDAHGQDIPGTTFAVSPSLFFHLADHLGHVVTDLTLGPLEQQLAGIGLGQTRELFQQAPLFIAGCFRFLHHLAVMCLAISDRLLFPGQLRRLLLQPFLFLEQALVELGQLRASLFELGLSLSAKLVELFLDLQAGLTLNRLGLLAPLLDQFARFLFRRADARLPNHLAQHIAGCKADDSHDNRNYDA